MKFRGALLLIVLYLVLPLVQSWVYLAGLPFADSIDTVNFAASIFAYHWLLANVLMSLKLPVLQNSLPYDLRIRIHVFSTLGLVAFVVWHGVYTIFLKAKMIDIVSWSLVGVFAGLLLLSMLWVPLPGFKTFRTKVQQAVRWGALRSYDWLKASHKVLFTALAALAYVHVVQSDILGEVPAVFAWAYQGLFLVTAAAFLWTRIRNLTLPSLEVVSVAAEGGIVRLALEPHARLHYRSGQFAFLRFDHPELRGEEHPFSFTSAGHENEVAFAVRPRGDFTAKLTQLKAGDRVRVNGGFGAFHPRRGTAPLALIGSGIGSAPLISILKDLAVREPHREVVCLLSVRSRDELLDAPALEALKAVMPQLTLRVLIPREDGQYYGPEVLARELGDATRFQCFVCASDEVRAVVVRALKGLGVRPRRIHFEAFNLG